MANSFTQGTSQKVLDHYFGGVGLGSPPGTLYVGVSTTTIADNGSNITEPSTANAYGRVALTNNPTNWPASSAADPSSKHNGVDITWAQATGAWGTLTDVFVSDAAIGGNILVYGTLTVAKTITTNDTLRIPATSLVITLT